MLFRSDVHWFPNGQLHTRFDFRPQADTVSIEYYSDRGNLKRIQRRYARDGMYLVLDQREYFESGMLQRSVERRSPLPTALPTDWEMVEKGFNEAGVMMRFTIRTEREYQEEIYYANGIKGIARHLLDNRLQGRFEELDSLGRIRVQIGRAHV